MDGEYGLGERNENGNRLVELLSTAHLFHGDIYFQKKRRLSLDVGITEWNCTIRDRSYPSKQKMMRADHIRDAITLHHIWLPFSPRKDTNQWQVGKETLILARKKTKYYTERKHCAWYRSYIWLADYRWLNDTTGCLSKGLKLVPNLDQFQITRAFPSLPTSCPKREKIWCLIQVRPGLSGW